MHHIQVVKSHVKITNLPPSKNNQSQDRVPSSFAFGPSFPVINIPNVRIVTTASESVMKAVTIRATGKQPLVRAVWTEKYRVTPMNK